MDVHTRVMGRENSRGRARRTSPPVLQLALPSGYGIWIVLTTPHMGNQPPANQPRNTVTNTPEEYHVQTSEWQHVAPRIFIDSYIYSYYL